MVKSYRVQVATTDSFSQIIEQAVTDNTSWAPKMSHSAFTGAEGLYWRVAALDEGNNAGGWATSPLRAAQRARMRVSGKLRKDRAGRLRVTVTGRRGKALRGAVVRVSGAGIVASPRRTGKRGRVVLRVVPRSRGTVLLSADKTGYSPARARVKVR